MFHFLVVKFSVYLNRHVFVMKCGQRRLWSDCAYAQADLSLRWVHISEGTFSQVAAQIFINQNILKTLVYKIIKWSTKDNKRYTMYTEAFRIYKSGLKFIGKICEDTITKHSLSEALKEGEMRNNNDKTNVTYETTVVFTKPGFHRHWYHLIHVVL